MKISLNISLPLDYGKIDSNYSNNVVLAEDKSVTSNTDTKIGEHHQTKGKDDLLLRIMSPQNG